MGDFSNDTNTTGTIDINGSATGNLETPGDRDWFAVELAADTAYVITQTGSGGGGGTLGDPFLRLRDGDGAVVASNDDFFDLDSVVQFTPDTTGTFYVEAGGYADNRTGTYTVAVTEVGPDLPGNTETEAVLALDAPVTETALLQDRDWIAVDLVAGQVYFVDLATDDDTANSFRLRLRDENGDNLGNFGTFEPGSTEEDANRVGLAVEADGRYFVDIQTSQTQLVEYTLSLSEGPLDTAPSNLTDETLAVGTPVEGHFFGRRDADGFAISVTAGQVYEVLLENGGTEFGEVRGRLYDDAGNEILDVGTLNGSGADSLFFEARATGDVFLDLRNFGGIYDYTVTLSEAPADIPEGALSDVALVLDTPVTSNFSAFNDRDGYAVTVQGGQVYRLDIDAGPGQFLDLYVDLLDAGGAFLQDAGYLFGEEVDYLYFQPEESGTAFLNFVNYFDTYEYTLTLSEGPDDIPGRNLSEVALELDTPVESNFFSFDDSDGFVVSLEDETIYRVEVAGPEDDFFEIRARIFDADGTVIENLGWRYDSSSVVYFFEADQTGTAFLDLRNFSGDFDYTVTLSEVPVPDDLGDTAETAVALDEADPAALRFDADNDEDWLAVTLEEGTDYRITMTSAGQGFGYGPARNPLMRVVDEDGAVIAVGDGQFGDDRVTEIFGVAETGTYFIVADAADIRDEAVNVDADYALSVESAVPLTEIGTDGDDTLEGGIARDFLDGGAGNDEIIAGDGGDTILGGDGDDNIFAQEGSDSVDAGAGGDLIGGGTGDDTVDTGSGSDEVLAGRGDDLLIGRDGEDSLWGGLGRDVIYGGEDGDFIGAGRDRDVVFAGSGDDEVGLGWGADLLWLGEGDDSGYGGRGSDTLYGGAGDDLVKGGGGDDHLDGGTGDDTLRGDWGEDTFHFAELTDGETDLIEDFETFQDLIVLNVAGEPGSQDPLTLADSLDLTFDDDGVTLIIEGHTIRVEGRDINESTFTATDIVLI